MSSHRSDGRIVEIGGYTEDEALELIEEVKPYKNELEQIFAKKWLLSGGEYELDEFFLDGIDGYISMCGHTSTDNIIWDNGNHKYLDDYKNSIWRNDMAIILSGDTHGLLEIDKVTEFFEFNSDYTKDDYLIILGDTGILWNGIEDKDVQSILNNLPVTTLWIDGNHENFDMLDDYPDDFWNGGKVHFISESIIHLARGQVFEIDGLRFFTFGGGNSIDKAGRQIGLSWWPNEMPSDYEYEEGLKNLEKVDWKVDYVLTHTCPEYIAKQLATYLHPGEEALQRYLNQIAENTEFEEWFFGHWHMDDSVDSFRCLYNDIVELN